MTQTDALQYAADRAAIEDLMARYLFALDWNDFDSFAATFTEDATFEYARGTLAGRDNIVATIKGFKEKIVEIYRDGDGNPGVLRHVLGQTVIRVEGDKAWTRAFWWEASNGGARNEHDRLTPEFGSFGVYEDELVRQGGQWLFAKRCILNEFLPGRESSAENPVLAMDRAADQVVGKRAGIGTA
jgi:hypothetical protein